MRWFPILWARDSHFVTWYKTKNRAFLPVRFLFLRGEASGGRTHNPLIHSQMLRHWAIASIERN